ncbi:hypothetical protein JVU11DRAFT_11929 [Chiua virens]|nr:hypothetical protein JVU11DRAFT_11929 [Chiua virens]
MGFAGYYAPPGNILVTIQCNESLAWLSHHIIAPRHAIWPGSKPDEVLDDSEATAEKPSIREDELLP